MITSSTCVSKYSLKAMTLNPSCLNKSPAFTVTMLPSTSKLISERLFDLNHMPKYSKNKIIKNINLVGIIFNTIIKSAFNTKSMLVGIVIGIKRSIFLNELLIGTTSMSSGINNMDKKVTANTLVIGSYFIVFIVSTLLTMLILIYKINTNVVDTSYINLLKNTFTYHYNTLGNYYLNLMITLLATSSIISGIYIGLSNINYLTNNKIIINITKLIILTTLTLGIYLNTDKIWFFIDIMMLSLITLNSIIIYKLRDKII